MTITQEIKILARAAGFHAVGITTAEPFTEDERILRARCDADHLPGLGYTPSFVHQVTHPKDTLPPCRSIISLALSYLTDDLSPVHAGGSPRGSMARFSWGKDYHQALHSRLSSLADAIQLKLGRRVEIRFLADTGPIIDRAAAVRSGIGSRGKNACLYAGEYGSWVVLGELLIDLDLEPDEPSSSDICGSCDKCMKACPTGALCAPYTIDTRLCLSRITQSKGFIPIELREAMGVRIYGCDTCQSACPHNKKATPGNLQELKSSEGLGQSPKLLPLMNISVSDFKSIVEPTTAGWIRRSRFRRNVAIALGNIGDPYAVPALVEALHDPAPIVRGHSAWALGKINTQAAIDALESAFLSEQDERVTLEIRLPLNGL